MGGHIKEDVLVVCEELLRTLFGEARALEQLTLQQRQVRLQHDGHASAHHMTDTVAPSGAVLGGKCRHQWLCIVIIL